MQYFISICFLGFFTALSSAVAIHQRAATPRIPELVPRAHPCGGNVLKPISLDTFKSAVDLEVRDVVDFTRLDPASQAELIFGAPGNNGSVLLANMTLYAPDGQQIVMMESFEGLTSAVDCKGDDGIMSLTFSSKEAFDAALEKWSFINEKDEDSFLLIANHDGCGPVDQRQAYTISKIDNEEAALMTTLTAKVAPWSEIAGNFDLNFGSATLAPGAARRFMPRGFFDDIADAVGDVIDDAKDVAKDVLDGAEKATDTVVDGFTDVVNNVTGTIGDAVGDAADTVGDAIGDVISGIGNAKLSREVIFDVTAGTPGKRFNVLTDPLNIGNPAIVLDCVDCFTTGKFKISGKLSVNNFNVQELTLDTSPQDFSTKIELEAKIAASMSPIPSRLNLTKEVASFPVPAAGVVVPGIFELGAVLTYEVAVESSISGTANFTFGLKSTLPNDAHIIVNLADIDSSTTTGFKATTFDPIFDFNSGSATLSVAAISRPKLTFGIEVVGIGKLEAGLNLGLPKINVALTAAFDKAGICDQKPGASKTGFKVSSNVILDLGLSVNGKFGPASILNAGTLFSVNLLEFEQPLFKKCFPFDIQGLNPTSSAVATTPVTVRARRAARY